MIRVIAFAPLSLALIGVVVLAAGLFGAEPGPGDAGLIGQPLPAFIAEPLRDGAPELTVNTPSGQAYVLNIFASWCAPCRVEHPVLTELAAAGVPLYGLAWRDGPADAAAFLDELGDPYTMTGLDLSGAIGTQLGVRGAPETLVVDKTGVVRAHIRGPITADIVARQILPMLNSQNATIANTPLAPS